MIIGKLFKTIMAQLNKIVNIFYKADPIAQMQYEIDRATDEIRSAKDGLAMSAGFVERLGRQISVNQKQVNDLNNRVKAYLAAGKRTEAAAMAVQLKKAQEELEENTAQRKSQEQVYNNAVTKMKHAQKKIEEARDRARRYESQLKLSRMEAELSEMTAQYGNIDVSTDFGAAESMVQEQIDKNKGKARAAADLAGAGMEEILQSEAEEAAMAEAALRDFEIANNLVTPESSTVESTQRQVGPAEVA